MQVIAAGAPTTRADRLAIARSALTAGLLVLAGVLVGWLIVGTSLIAAFTPHGRPSVVETATAIVAWGLAIIVPGGFLLIGVARIVATIEAVLSLRPGSVAPRLAKSLGPDHVVVTNLLLPGGRRLHELVFGPYGVVVLGDVPPPNHSRHVGSRWEIRDGRGRWIPIEAPLDRAERDAERVRGWLSNDDRDFLVRVYAAIVTSDRRVDRTPACAVVAPEDLAGWLAALPAQRGLTPERRQRLLELIRSMASTR